MQFAYKNTSNIREEDIMKVLQRLRPYIETIQNIIRKGTYEDPECTVNLPTDEKILADVLACVKRFDIKKVKYVIDIGIGGSNLGTKAVYDALVGFYDVMEADRYPKMLFADTTNPEFLARLSEFIENKIHNPSEVIINAISKSGGTTETTANMEVIVAALQKKFGDKALKQVVITTEHGSKLWKAAQDKKIAVLEMSGFVGGRYSVLSPVGLFPLAVAGFDIKSFRKGAAAARAVCMNLDPEKNPAMMSAITLYLHSQNGKNINDNFFFNQELESVGKWYRQLMGESIGKDGKGITPTVSIGSTDLHSVGQLYLGGPKDKITTFVSAQKVRHDATIPVKPLLPGLVGSIYGMKATAIMSAILQGVKAAYRKQELPYMEVILDDISERSIGEYFQFKMIEMMYLGKLLEVNPFDQPHVELYKIETKKILGS